MKEIPKSILTQKGRIFIESIEKQLEELKLSKSITVDELLSAVDNANRLAYICAKCSGSGTMEGQRHIKFIQPMNPNGEFKLRCDLCDGVGYTKQEYKPIIGVVGFEVKGNKHD